MSKRIHGLGGVVGAVVAAALGTAVGCGAGFANDDCHESRNCAAAAGDSAVGGAFDGNDTTVGGAAGSPATPIGGVASLAGAGGNDTECTSDVDCSNDNAEDGAEVCNSGECLAGNPPPTVVSFTPESDAVDVEPDTSIVIEFSEPLDPKTVTKTTIQVLDGTTVVPGELAYADGKVTFTPSAPLALRAPYTLSVETGVTDAEGTPLLTDVSSTFVVRDGAWQTIDVVKGEITSMSGALPMTSTGSTLLAWVGRESTGNRCPATARWFLRGKATTAVERFPVDGQNDCEYISSAASAAGAAAVVWTSPSPDQGITVQQYRADAWLPNASLLSKNYNSSFGLAFAPSGVVTLFEHDPSLGSLAWITDATGKWPANGDSLSTHIAQGQTSAVFDAKGNGLAVWRAQDQAGTKLERIVASRLTAATEKWAAATDLPGTVAAPPANPVQGRNPVVALDSRGDGLALWVDASSTGKVMASRFAQSAWAEPEALSGALVVDALYDPPALVFDGRAFVAAWTAQEGGKRYAYTARYDLQTGWDTYRRQQGAAGDGTSAAKMPQLVGDGRGNLLLVYVKGGAPTFTLMYQRYAGDAWSEIKAVPDGTLSTEDLDNTYNQVLALSASSNGLASLAWANYDVSQYPPLTGIRLASFY